MIRGLVLVSLGVACVLGSTYLVYLQLPKPDRAPPKWMMTESGETKASLGWFMLMVAGITMIIKGLA